MGIKKLKQTIKSFDGVVARAGWFSSARYDDNTPVAQVAMWQEYGNSQVKPRPFMRPTIMEKTHEWVDYAAQGVRVAVRGDLTAEQVMTALAQKVAGDIRQKIAKTRNPPISAVTHLLRQWRREGVPMGKITVWRAIQAVKKGVRATGVSDQPLNDTGHMISTLTGIAVRK